MPVSSQKKQARKILVRVEAGAKKEDISVKNENTFVVTIKEKPKHGRANERLCELLGAYFDLPKKNIVIVKGHHRCSKIVVIYPLV